MRYVLDHIEVNLIQSYEFDAPIIRKAKQYVLLRLYAHSVSKDESNTSN